MEIYLVRHGETTWNAMDRVQGWVAVPLNEKGKAQAVKLRDLFISIEFSAIYSSDLERAVQTARIIAEPHGLEVKQLWGLREVKRGLLNGLTLTEITFKFPNFLKDFREDPYTTRPPEGESLRDAEERIRDALEEIRLENRGKRILIVAHVLTNIVIQSVVLEKAITPTTYKEWFMQPGEFRVFNWPDDRSFKKAGLTGTWRMEHQSAQ
ncbi:MAG: alpha-ribazole phosphatase [Candidatus Hydrothermota bacterium]|nr:MAG: alpha-ribazole phosphatase [Candidatus Hydrothermae bacterium]